MRSFFSRAGCPPTREAGRRPAFIRLTAVCLALALLLLPALAGCRKEEEPSGTGSAASTTAPQEEGPAGQEPAGPGDGAAEPSGTPTAPVDPSLQAAGGRIVVAGQGDPPAPPTESAASRYPLKQGEAALPTALPGTSFANERLEETDPESGMQIFSCDWPEGREYGDYAVPDRVYGLKDAQGNIRIPPRYTELTFADPDRLVARIGLDRGPDEQYALLDFEGNEVTPFAFYGLTAVRSPSREDTVYIACQHKAVHAEIGVWLVDRNGEPVADSVFTAMQYIPEEDRFVCVGEKGSCFLSANGEVLDYSNRYFVEVTCPSDAGDSLRFQVYDEELVAEISECVSRAYRTAMRVESEEDQSGKVLFKIKCPEETYVLYDNWQIKQQESAGGAIHRRMQARTNVVAEVGELLAANPTLLYPVED